MYRGTTQEPLFFTWESSRGTYGFGNGAGDHMGRGRGGWGGAEVSFFQRLPPELENEYWRGIQYFSAL